MSSGTPGMSLNWSSSAPYAFRICERSSETPGWMTLTKRYPRALQMAANEMPVLPLVKSKIVSPGCSVPAASAPSIMPSAMRSFTEPDGLKYSSLASTRAPSPSSRSRPWSSTRGVDPTSSAIDP